MRVLHMNFGSLFSGIGGLDLGLERAGFKCLWQSEINPYASRVLKKHWPDTPNLGDINEIDWRTVPTVDLVCGGYPCQPFSIAGVRKGENDERHLWPMFAECLRVVRPRFALLENVTGHLSLGFGDVQSDLAALGYDAQWDCIPAAAVGAPHLRDRIFVIARDTRAEQRRPLADSNNKRSHVPLCTRWNAPWYGYEVVADTGRVTAQIFVAGRQPAVTVAERNTWWSSEPELGRVANGIPHRMDRLRGLGNAVVPQVAEHIGNIIKATA